MSALAAWLLTYLLHSTVLLGGAGLLRAVLGERRLGLQEAVLRAALVGGFLTATLQVGLGVQPLGGVLALPGDAPAPGPVAAVVVVADEAPVASTPEDAPVTPVPAEAAVRASAPAAPASTMPTAAVWQPALVGLWLLLALVALVRLGVAADRLRRLLSPRRPLSSGALLSKAAVLAEGLGLRRAVPVSASPRLEVPLATGVVRPEVCLPTRALEELEGEQQEALCAHELAHVARRDPAWILVARLAEAVAPAQPLNFWARRRLQDLAECLSDDLAVAASGRPERLARSLVDVASWTVSDAVPFPAVAAGAVSSRSRLGHRVERLMDPLRALERPRRLLLPLSAAVVLATALVTPAVSGSTAADAPEPPAAPAPAAVPAATAPPAPPAVPAPPAPPAAPKAPQAEAPEAPAAPEAPQTPRAPNEPRSDAERELEELTQRIEERVEKHSAGIEQMGAEIERLVEAHMPPAEEMERLSREVEKAAETLAESHLAEREGREKPSEAELDQARADLEAAKNALHEATKDLRLPDAEMKRIQKQAKEMAKAAALTPEEKKRLKELTQQIVEESMPDLEEMKREMRDVSRSLSRETMEQIRESLRTVREAMREAMPRAREQSRAARKASRSAAAAERSAIRAERGALRETRRAEREKARREKRERSLEEAESSPLEETTPEEPPEV